MDTIPHCNDIFVTQNGKPYEPIIGWVTENKLIEHSRID